MRLPFFQGILSYHQNPIMEVCSYQQMQNAFEEEMHSGSVP